MLIFNTNSYLIREYNIKST